MTFFYLIGALAFIWGGLYMFGDGEKKSEDWKMTGGVVTSIVGGLYFIIKIIMYWNGYQ